MPHDVGANIFVSEIASAYREAGCDVVLGRENLSHLMCRPAIVHLHWPEEHFFNWGGEMLSSEARAGVFLTRLDELKSMGARLVWQVHNLRPHESRSVALEHRVYQSVIDRADVFVHHCDASVRLLRERYAVPSDRPNVVRPLGNYLAYPNAATKTTARTHLGLDPHRLVFLHFGAVRAYKGLDLLLEAFAAASIPGKLLLVAGRFAAMRASTGTADRIRFALFKRFGRNVRFDLRMIPDDEVQYYLNAADVVVLSHRAGLNSAVAVLGMTFGRAIVGPDMGCMGSLLRDSGNLTYEPGDTAGLARALERSVAIDFEQLGERNRTLASTWRWSDIPAAVLRALPSTSAKSEEQAELHPARP
jgi:glycosyltransferase involved in cell wall biosynthesis